MQYITTNIPGIELQMFEKINPRHHLQCNAVMYGIEIECLHLTYKQHQTASMPFADIECLSIVRHRIYLEDLYSTEDLKEVMKIFLNCIALTMQTEKASKYLL